MIKAITLDLDDTLWPIAPVIERAEQALADWLSEHCPEVAAAWPIPEMRRLRERIGADHPALAHDFTRLRILSLTEAFAPFRPEPIWAERAFEVFYAERNRVELYPEAHASLASLAARYPLASLSNGNADLKRCGIDHHFAHAISPREVGAAKPDPRIFAAAAERLGVAPAAIVHVGDDAELDVLGAKAAGFRAVWINRNDQAWPHAVVPDAIIRTLDELDRAIAGFTPIDRNAHG